MPGQQSFVIITKSFLPHPPSPASTSIGFSTTFVNSACTTKVEKSGLSAKVSLSSCSETSLKASLVDDPRQDAAATNLWAVYVTEAEKYDKGLVESWKSDMEGMLIFDGLFSASLTAFLMESYQTLTPDSGDMTVLLLQQISQQLAASVNGTTYIMPAPVAFTPTLSSLVCNILWFLSLGLSLGCALTATLVKQWARDFLHRANMRSAPVDCARIFSYLYYGLKRFRMHSMVDIIPLLLHTSLLFFFAGLVAFLIPVNTTVTAVAAALLGTITIVYSLFTVFPLIHFDCPYRTPLSVAFWNLKRHWMNWSHQQEWATPGEEHIEEVPTDNNGSMVESMMRRATESSQERALRDKSALIWTVKSLDGTALEPLWMPSPMSFMARMAGTTYTKIISRP
ncbi:hypothetical protein B0H14DRAFT_2405509 [Mycena olivaceomarginata]|nr:hypothetical protein B0H14DRAFT_2405509 [Mycena olivaceomarginata]